MSEGYRGVLEPAGLTLNQLDSVRAVILDDNLSAAQKNRVIASCLEHKAPFFFWSVPAELSSDDAEHFDRLVLSFLSEQNEWKSLPPSPETLAQIELQTLIDIITTANSLLEPDEVMHTVMTRIHQLISCEAWSVLILDNNAENTLSFAAAYGPGKEQLVNLKVPFGQGIAGWVAKHRQPIIVNNAQDDPRFMSEIDQDTQFVTENILCAPLVSRGRTIGVLEMLNHDNPDGFTENDLELVQTLVNPAAVAIENAYLFQKSQQLTIQDDLTKLFNSRHLNGSLELELKRARRNSEPLSLMFLDLDGFKAVNDNYGHLQGSQSLIDVADLIKQVSRDTDIVSRYGGDEFVLILPNTDLDGAMIMAERIRTGIESYQIKDIRLSASIGVASYPRHGQTKEALIRLADQAMYRVKENGKNGILSA